MPAFEFARPIKRFKTGTFGMPMIEAGLMRSSNIQNLTAI
jgi:hypothetical protein